MPVVYTSSYYEFNNHICQKKSNLKVQTIGLLRVIVVEHFFFLLAKQVEKCREEKLSAIMNKRVRLLEIVNKSKKSQVKKKERRLLFNFIDSLKLITIEGRV